MNNPSHNTLYPISFRPMQPKMDAAMLQKWLNHPHAKYWGMLDASQDEITAAYQKLLAIPDYQVYIGAIHNEPTFLMEFYNPKTDAVGAHYEVQQGDGGMHILVKAPTQPISGFTWHIFSNVMEFLFYQKGVQRIVVEPDVANEKIHRLNKRAGFEYSKIIELEQKKAYLAFCTVQQYEAAQAPFMPI